MMTQPSRLATVAAMILAVASFSATGCTTYKMGKSDLHEVWHWPFVPLNTVEQQDVGCKTQCVVEPPCFGYHATCWQPWPEGCGECPNQMMGCQVPGCQDPGCQHQVMEEQMVPMEAGEEPQPAAEPQAPAEPQDSVLDELPDTPAPAAPVMPESAAPAEAPQPVAPEPAAPAAEPPAAEPPVAEPAVVEPKPAPVAPKPIPPAPAAEPAVPEAPAVPVPPKDPQSSDSSLYRPQPRETLPDLFQEPAAEPLQRTGERISPSRDSGYTDPDWIRTSEARPPLRQRLRATFVSQPQETTVEQIETNKSTMQPVSQPIVRPALQPVLQPSSAQTEPQMIENPLVNGPVQQPQIAPVRTSLGRFITVAEAQVPAELQPVPTSLASQPNIIPATDTQKVRVYLGDDSK